MSATVTAIGIVQALVYLTLVVAFYTPAGNRSQKVNALEKGTFVS